FIMVLDSFGIGATEDAERFGDVGADTLGHIAEACAKGEADNGRKGPLNLPNLTRLGLAKAHEGSTGFIPAGMDGNAEVIGAYAWAHEMSSGKDTPSGHWEIAGVPVLFEWGYFSDHENSFPQELLDKLVERANLPGYLGNCHSSGTVILDQLGEEHMKTGKPIFYTSADSVFQIACHEETFGLDKLYELCEIAREELTNGGYNIGRVIARPFIGDKAGNFQRTGNRHDLAVEPPAPTVLQKLVDEKHGQVVSVGFVDFDSSWGHRRDVAGYAAGLELFDRRLPELMSLLRDDDILILTADHGCDPTWTGTDHTREHIPVLVYGPKVKPGSLGHRETFADIGQTLAKYFGTSDMEYGKAMF
ncbi:MAG: phosphopentomutase, partial [Escherichia coli]|nr:phosphopentomutase [Escherichia coli]